MSSIINGSQWTNFFHSPFYAGYSLWYLLLMLISGLIAGRIVKNAIYYLPTMLKLRWRKESGLYLATFATADCNRNNGRLSQRYFSNTDIVKSVQRFYTRVFFNRINAGRYYRRSRVNFVCRYPIIELFTAVITILAGCRFSFDSAGLAALIFSYVLIILMAIDFNELLLPDELTLLLLWTGLLFNLRDTFAGLDDAVIGAAVGYLSLWSLYRLIKAATGIEGLGYGDFKLTAALGAWLGWQALHEIILLSSIIGLTAVGGIYSLKDKTILDKPIPFGSCLSLSGMLFLFKPNLLETLLLRA